MSSKGFSLLELLGVMAIIAILLKIAVPSYQLFQAKTLGVQNVFNNRINQIDSLIEPNYQVITDNAKQGKDD